ncbi:MAG: site-specific DNA-methyltransferase [Alphaproteobacteria bacterium]|nr:site-specific DNA-methyltransferase [Alphaproteobacteria bacterium]
MLSPREEQHSGYWTSGWRERLRQAEVRNWEVLHSVGTHFRRHLSERATYILGDALELLASFPPCSLQAIVTDPPYGLEYEEKDHGKLRAGRGGVWRIPPSFDGANRRPLPRFTVLSAEDLRNLQSFFIAFGRCAMGALAPGGHIIIASNPLLSSMTFCSLQQAGFEKRGEIIRLVQTLRGGDKPKGYEAEFPEVSVMPRACWEPWGIFRKPFEGTVADNLRRWGTGGLRRIGNKEPLKDVIQCSPTRGREKEIAPHPSLKPQRFLRQVVRASLPLAIGIVYDPFAGSGSTLAAAEAIGYRALGADRDPDYLEMSSRAFAQLAALPA